PAVPPPSIVATRQCSVPTGSSVVGVAVVPNTSAVQVIELNADVVETWMRYLAARATGDQANSGFAWRDEPAAGVRRPGGSRLSAQAGAAAVSSNAVEATR